MSMTREVPPSDHPTWCAAPSCESAESADVLHSSTPETWTAALDDVEITAWLGRYDERLADGTLNPGEQGVHLHLRDTASLDPTTAGELHCEVLLSLADAEHLATQLVRHIATAWRTEVDTGQ